MTTEMAAIVRDRGSLLVLAVCGLVACATSSAHGAGVSAPELGVTWVFECGENSRWNDRYTFTPTAVEDKILRFDWTAGDKTGTIETPVASLYTGFKTKKVIGDRTTKQVIEWGDLSFDDIEVGERTEAWVRQSDSRHGRNRWQWSAEVTAQTSIDIEAMGALDVFVIEQTRYCEEWRYRAVNVIYYSPDLNGPVYWKYTDSNGDTEECRLVARVRRD